MKRWYASDPNTLDEQDKVRHDLAVITMELACAIRHGISYRIEERHITSFGEHMLAYLKGIRRILPGQSLLPSHHNALHIPDFLRRFGPMPGWWMFPFERVIGLLQKVKTNGKIGKKDGIILCLRDSPQL